MNREEIAEKMSCLLGGILYEGKFKDKAYLMRKEMWDIVADWHIAELKKARKLPVPIDADYFNAEIENAKREARVEVATDAYTYFTMCPDFGRPPRLTCADDRIMVRQYLRKIINQNKGKV